jgi:phosphate starvation-inducible protein PhoH and related proteins
MTKTKRITRRDKIEQGLDLVPPQTPRAPKQFHVQPKTAKQNELMKAIRRCPITITLGPAGCGKSYVSTSTISNLFLSGEYEKIVISRPNVSTGKSLGFFPGSLKEKMTPWLLPITTTLEKCFGKTHYEYLLAKDTIEMTPIEVIRGRSFENSLIIVDECQNLTFSEIKAISTRLGENSKLVMCADPAQADWNNGMDILKFAKLCNKHGISIPVIQFTSDDIVRSDIVGDIVRMLEKEGL